MLENFNEDKRKNSTTQFSDFHTGWSIIAKYGKMWLIYRIQFYNFAGFLENKKVR